jgi:hypothetical protein
VAIFCKKIGFFEKNTVIFNVFFIKLNNNVIF